MGLSKLDGWTDGWTEPWCMESSRRGPVQQPSGWDPCCPLRTAARDPGIAEREIWGARETDARVLGRAREPGFASREPSSWLLSHCRREAGRVCGGLPGLCPSSRRGAAAGPAGGPGPRVSPRAQPWQLQGSPGTDGGGAQARHEGTSPSAQKGPAGAWPPGTHGGRRGPPPAGVRCLPVTSLTHNGDSSSREDAVLTDNPGVAERPVRWPSVYGLGGGGQVPRGA